MCAGSIVTGPGPLDGEKNSWPMAIHPTLLFGAKSGALRSCAASAGHKAAAAHANSTGNEG
jgi:hypothetical protein